MRRPRAPCLGSSPPPPRKCWRRSHRRSRRPRCLPALPREHGRGNLVEASLTISTARHGRSAIAAHEQPHSRGKQRHDGSITRGEHTPAPARPSQDRQGWRKKLLRSLSPCRLRRADGSCLQRSCPRCRPVAPVVVLADFYLMHRRSLFVARSLPLCVSTQSALSARAARFVLQHSARFAAAARDACEQLLAALG